MISNECQIGKILDQNKDKVEAFYKALGNLSQNKVRVPAWKANS
jgi:hypothetical protein